MCRNLFKEYFPKFLGTRQSPGFPKQLEDIHLAISFLKSSFTQNVTFALFGASAGAHLSMLYGYSRDSQTKDVRAVVSLVGPGDLTDPGYTENPLLADLFLDLVGPCYYSECPQLYNATSPTVYISRDSTPTLGFYGNVDPLVPISQVPLIRDKLNSFGVINQFTVYLGGHGDWAWEYTQDLLVQTAIFFTMHWV